jgi:hypothetical protein
MPCARLYILVEGDDDLRFVEQIVIPKLSSRYDFIQSWKYAQEKAEKVNAFLRSIKSMGADYLFLGDLNAYSCFPKKRQALLRRFKQLDRRQALIVVREIEGWYLAGLENRNPLRVRVPADTSNLTKEQFNSAMPNRFDSRIDYMLEILTFFDINKATKRNPSFHYFARRWGLRA